MEIPMLDIFAKAEVGKSLAGFTLGDKLDSFIPFVDKVVDGSITDWNIDLVLNNNGVLLYKWSELYGGGTSIFIDKPKIELLFTIGGLLQSITVSDYYNGEIFEGGIKIGSAIGEIKHPLVLDDTEDIHYLDDGNGGIIDGIYFVADGLEVDEDPEQKIQEARVYNYNID